MLTVIPVVLYFIFGEQPVAMVKWGGAAQAWTLPIISLGTVFLVRRFLPREMRASRMSTAFLWIGAIVITLFVLISESRRWNLF
jgi:hypothetical protein